MRTLGGATTIENLILSLSKDEVFARLTLDAGPSSTNLSPEF